MTFSEILLAFPLWFLNGWLVILYWLAGHIPELVSLGVGLVIAFGIDPYVQSRASDRPRRYRRGEVHTASPSASYFTLFALATWLVASMLSRFPVPLLGGLLWFTGLLSILAVSEERFNQLWWVKTGISAYAVIVLILRFGLQGLQSANPAEWAAVVGSSADAQVVLSQIRSNVAMIGMLFVFVLFPLGFIASLFNRFLRNPKPLYNIWLEAGDVVRRMRTRT